MHPGFSKLALAAGLLALPATSQAMLQTAIFRVPVSGTDVTGVFGVPNRTFVDTPATLKFYFDNNPRNIDPIYKTKLTILGQDYSFAPTGSHIADLDYWDIHDGPTFKAYYEEGEADVTPYRYLSFNGRAHGAPPIFMDTYLDFEILSFNPNPNTITEHAYASGWRGKLSDFQIVNYVPEPASWAMMIAGFCLVGTALRRRRLAVA